MRGEIADPGAGGGATETRRDRKAPAVAAAPRWKSKTRKSPGDHSADATMSGSAPRSATKPTTSALRPLLEKVYQLKRCVETTPGENLPEFRFADDSFWIEAVKGSSRQMTESSFARRSAQREGAGAV